MELSRAIEGRVVLDAIPDMLSASILLAFQLQRTLSMKFSRFLLCGLIVTISAFVFSFGAVAETKLKVDLFLDGSDGFTVGGWDRKVADTGTIYYTCREDSCGRGSTVSMHSQTQRPQTAEEMRSQEKRIGDVIIERTGGLIARVDIGEPDILTKASLSMGKVTRTLVASKPGDMGFDLNWTSGFVALNKKHYTLSSSAISREHADENFDIYQRLLVLVLGGKS